uniref:Uncharacterized protein n=1 Tax=Triticum urartu TaxID=4572 RepID=A0A8R7VEN4_TRIUA
MSLRSCCFGVVCRNMSSTFVNLLCLPCEEKGYVGAFGWTKAPAMKRRELHSLLAILVTIFVITCRVYPQKKLVECDGLIGMLCNQSTYPIICIMTDCDQGLHSVKKTPIYMFISD